MKIRKSRTKFFLLNWTLVGLPTFVFEPKHGSFSTEAVETGNERRPFSEKDRMRNRKRAELFCDGGSDEERERERERERETETERQRDRDRGTQRGERHRKEIRERHRV
jgi:hypothetical protein